MATRPPDAIVLDVLMPGIDGLEVCRRLRAGGDRTPILMLTALDGVRDRVGRARRGRRRLPGQAVRAGGAARAPARAAAADGRAAAGRARCASPTWRSTRVAYEARRGGRPIELTRTEFALLELFLRHPRQVLTRDVIFDRVWGYDFGPELQQPRGLRRLPAPQDRGRRRAAPDPHRPRRRLRAARGADARASSTASTCARG